MRFSICDFDNIKSNASSMATAIFTHNEVGISMVVDMLVSTAASQARYTRSVAIVAQQVHQTLQSAGAHDLAGEFRLKLVDEAIGTYVDFWLEYLGYTPKDDNEEYAPDFIDPFAISSFIGDLLSSSLITFRAFEVCVDLLLDKDSSTVSRMQLRAVEMLIARGCAYQQLDMTCDFLYNCLETVRTKCTRFFGFYTIDEQRIKELLYDILYRGHVNIYPNIVDWKLNDLTDILMGSVCIPSPCSTPPQPSPSEVKENLIRIPSPSVPILKKRDEKDAYITCGTPISSPKRLAREVQSDSGSDSDTGRTRSPILHMPQPVRAYIVELGA